MTTLTERDLQITIADKVVSARKFDDPAIHGLNNCMKAVDFIVELESQYLFIEIKDPQDPEAPDQSHGSFLQRFQSGQIDEDLKYKYRDSFLYEWASGRANKPIHYLVLIGLDTLTSPMLLNRTTALQQKLPLQGNSWVRPIVTSCNVFNVASWNRVFQRYHVVRRSSA